MGICDSNGITFDFGGAISVGSFMFGRPLRYIELDPMKTEACGGTEEEAKENWDLHVDGSCMVYEKVMHLMVCGSDCHSHVAYALNTLEYGGCSCWNKVVLAAWVFFCGRHVSWASVACVWLPFAVFLTLILM
jgi:hypothetical protein